MEAAKVQFALIENVKRKFRKDKLVLRFGKAEVKNKSGLHFELKVLSALKSATISWIL
jgi:hypothetical protein